MQCRYHRANRLTLFFLFIIITFSGWMSINIVFIYKHINGIYIYKNIVVDTRRKIRLIDRNEQIFFFALCILLEKIMQGNLNRLYILIEEVRRVTNAFRIDNIIKRLYIEFKIKMSKIRKIQSNFWSIEEKKSYLCM